MPVKRIRTVRNPPVSNIISQTAFPLLQNRRWIVLFMKDILLMSLLSRMKLVSH